MLRSMNKPSDVESPVSALLSEPFVAGVLSNMLPVEPVGGETLVGTLDGGPLIESLSSPNGLFEPEAPVVLSIVGLFVESAVELSDGLSPNNPEDPLTEVAAAWVSVSVTV